MQIEKNFLMRLFSHYIPIKKIEKVSTLKLLMKKKNYTFRNLKNLFNMLAFLLCTPRKILKANTLKFLTKK